MTTGSSEPLQLAPLVAFAAVVAAVIGSVIRETPLLLPLPSFDSSCRNRKVVRVPVNVAFWHPPLAGVVVLWLCGVIDWKTVWAGLAGDAAVKPFGIIILFMSLAYVCISLDLTGVLAWAALSMARAAGRSSRRLMVLVFLMASLVTIVTSNDIVILTLTPIIYYFSLATRCNPIPYLITEFVAANVCSMLLVVGNPTNSESTHNEHYGMRQSLTQSRGCDFACSYCR